MAEAQPGEIAPSEGWHRGWQKPPISAPRIIFRLHLLEFLVSSWIPDAGRRARPAPPNP
jgi:hypothetical protein